MMTRTLLPAVGLDDHVSVRVVPAPTVASAEAGPRVMAIRSPSYTRGSVPSRTRAQGLGRGVEVHFELEAVVVQRRCVMRGALDPDRLAESGGDGADLEASGIRR